MLRLAAILSVKTGAGKGAGPGGKELGADVDLVGPAPPMNAGKRRRIIKSGATVVFDAAGAPAGSTPEHVVQGMKIYFALKGQQADDVIEELIQHDAAPKQLTVAMR